MTERLGKYRRKYDSEELWEEMDRVDSLGKFSYVLGHVLPHVPVESLLANFTAQNQLHDLTERYSHKTRADQVTPVIILKKPGETPAGTRIIGGTVAIETQRFRLDDKKHIYYFKQIAEGESLRVRFLDPETQVFPVEPTDVYPLNRVPVKGGLAQWFDYQSSSWQAHEKQFFLGVGVGNNRMGKVRLPRVLG